MLKVDESEGNSRSMREYGFSLNLIRENTGH